MIDKLADKLNPPGNCYGCNKSGHVLRDSEKNSNRNPVRNNYNKGLRRDSRDITCYNCDKKGHFARDCRGPRKNNQRDEPQDKEVMRKMIQEMMVTCNTKSSDFQ